MTTGALAALALVLTALAAPPARAAEAGVKLLDARVDLDDQASLQRGARLFVNYCLSCHSARYMRYNRMGRDLGIDTKLLRENLMFTTEKPGDTMEVAMRPADALKWFGVAPPDLSVIARARGADWLYTYFLTFYADPDPARPFGVNNLVFPQVGMPHVLADLQGLQVMKPHEQSGEEGAAVHGPRLPGELLTLAQSGTLNPAQYRRAARDLTAFLVYMGEPAQLVRYRLGLWVLLFIAVFFWLSRALYKEYWKDIH